MAKPKLLVDQAQRLVDGSALFGPDLDVGKSQKLEDLVLRPPDAAQLILRPAAGRGRHDLAFASAFAGPTPRLEILLEDLDWRSIVALFLDFFLAQDHAPALPRDVPPRLAVPVAGPATFASSAAMRA